MDESDLPKPTIMQICPIDFGECKKREEIEKEFNPFYVFLDIPYSDYSPEYEKAIQRVIESFGLTPILAETRRVTEGLLCNVCKTIQKSRYAVADISGNNKNVTYELGIIHSLGKKCCILCDFDTKIPVDLSGLIIYKYSDKHQLSKNVLKWITDNVEEIISKIANQRKIFNAIFYQIEKKDLIGIEWDIHNIREKGDLNILEKEYNLLIEKLKDFLNNTNNDIINRERAAYLLGKIGDDKAIDTLVTTLKDKHSEVRGSAATALGEIGNVSAVIPLIEVLEDKKAHIYEESLEALIKINDPSAIESLIGALNKMISQRQQYYKNSTNEIEKLDSTNSLTKILMDTFANQKLDQQRYIINILGRFGDKRAVEPLIAALKDKDLETRWLAAEALGDLGDNRAIEPLLALLSDNSPIPTINENDGLSSNEITVAYIAKQAIDKIKFAQKEKKKK